MFKTEKLLSTKILGSLVDYFRDFQRLAAGCLLHCLLLLKLSTVSVLLVR